MSSPSKAVESSQAESLQWRTWTAANGTSSQEAAFVALEDSCVHVVTRNGSKGRLPLDRLSLADQEYVRQETKEAETLFQPYVPPKPTFWTRLKAEGWQSPLGKSLWLVPLCWWCLLFATGLVERSSGGLYGEYFGYVVLLFFVLWFSGIAMAIHYLTLLVVGWQQLKQRPGMLAATFLMATVPALFMTFVLFVVPK
jgi:hypothetical protein